jgi:fatty-acyl-CoA synthase
MDVAYLVRRAARTWPDTGGVEDSTQRRSLATLVARAERFANALDALDVPPEACVAILSTNRVEYVEIDIGIAFARRVRVALNGRLHLEDHRFVIADAGARVLIHSREYEAEADALHEEFGITTIALDPPSGDSSSLYYEDLIEDAASTSVLRSGQNGDEGPAWITYTAGTTGRPKGIVLSHRSIREVAYNLLVEFGPVAPGDVIVLPQPLSHGAGYWVLPYLISGGGIYVIKRFDPEEVHAISQRPDVRTLKCVPAMLPPLIESSAPFGYDTVIYGASPIPQPVLGAALDRFGPVLAQVYGQSEAPITITCLGKEDHVGDGDRRFSAGRPFRTVAVEVWDQDGHPLPPGEEGEVAVTGSHLMNGYLGLDGETAAVLKKGWELTRDMGMFDERGFLRLLGRRDEMIISGGYNISPREVENVLSLFPGVEEVAVIGTPDERWGSAVSAAIKMMAGFSATSDELIEFARPRLSFRAPRRVAFVDSIPKTPYGKVDRPKLLDAIAILLEAAQ